jgi:hypothetical protein
MIDCGHSTVATVSGKHRTAQEQLLDDLKLGFEQLKGLYVCRKLHLFGRMNQLCMIPSYEDLTAKPLEASECQLVRSTQAYGARQVTYRMSIKRVCSIIKRKFDNWLEMD